MSETSRSTALRKPRLTDEEIKEFQEIFDLVDEDKSGAISSEELAALFATVGITIAKDEVDISRS